jgi:ABC-type sugar transport system ATPase subunit
MPSATPAISFDRITVRFPGVVALRDVSLAVLPGELHAIVGENGAGKSTLMKCLAGILDDYEGHIALWGRQVRFRSVAAARQAGIGILHQELNLVDELSVAANIFLGREKPGRCGFLDNRGMERAAAGLLRPLECDIPPRQPAGRLRIGDQQLVEIAKALSLDARVLIMDEPTSALTEVEAARLFSIIRRLRAGDCPNFRGHRGAALVGENGTGYPLGAFDGARAGGLSIFYISHKMDEVFRLADRITVLRDGRLVRTVARAETDPREITHLMVGRPIESAAPRYPRAVGDVLLEVRNLSLPWPGHARPWRLRDISFTLHRGEILGLAGLMGAGRTELLECLFGASPQPPQGEILIAGRPAALQNPTRALRAGIALLTEDRKRLGIFPNLSVLRNITLCSLDRAARLGGISASRERTLARDAAGQLGVKAPDLAAPITSLSGGNQQKALIGRWLLANPKVLLLDDPTRGVDIGAKADLYAIMDRLCREGIGIIVTSGELIELLAVCDRILVLCEGRLTGELRRGEASEQRIMELMACRPTDLAGPVRS